MKKKVVVFSQIDPEILTRLQQQYHLVEINPKLGDVTGQIQRAVIDADGMIGAGRLLNDTHLSAAQKLKIISSVSVGYDNYDLACLNQKGIWLAHTPHVLTETTADLAFTLLMSAAKQVGRLDQWTKQGHWKRTVAADQFGQEIFGQTLGIIGLGNIGQAIARRGFHGFNMNILYHGRQEKPERAEAVNARYCSLYELLQQSDFVVLAVDLNADSAHLIDKNALAQMQKHAVLVNISRGQVLDEQALVEAIQRRSIFAAGLDVYPQEPLQQSELFALEHVVTLPHVGSATAMTRKKMAELAYRQLVDALEGQQPRYLVNPNFT